MLPYNHPAGDGHMEWFNMAVAAIKLAIAGNRSFAVMSGVFAAGIIGAALLFAFGGRPEFALLAVAFVIAFSFVLLAFLASGSDAPPGRRLLAEVLAWLFSFAMVASIALTISSFFVCSPARFGSHCVARHVSIDDFRRLDETKLRKLGVGEFALSGLELKRGGSDVVAYNALDDLAIPWIMTFSGFRTDSKLTFVLLYSTDGKHFTNYKTLDIQDAKEWWKKQPLVKNLNLPMSEDDKWKVVLEFVKDSGINLVEGGVPLLWVSTCFEPPDVGSGKGYLMVIVFDNDSHTATWTSSPISVTFQQRSPTIIGERCP